MKHIDNKNVMANKGKNSKLNSNILMWEKIKNDRIKISMTDEQEKDAQKIKNEQWSALIRVVELFRRYFSGEASMREQNSIEIWNPIENEEELMSDKRLEKDCDTALVWNAVSTELKFNINHNRNRFHIRNIHHYAAAAVLFILLGGGILFYTQHNAFNQPEYGVMADANSFFQTTDVQTKQITLPDGSKIHLNRGTKLSYASDKFNRRQREVWLTGEAFFEVAKNPDKPFIIHTGDMVTTVRGTSFNVKAYPQLNENVVSVKTGKVEISAQNAVLAMLTPGKQVIYNASTGKSDTQEVNLSEIAAWSDGRLVLNNASITELKLRIKQQFGAEVQINTQTLESVKMNAVFYKDATLQNVMEIISGLYGIRYEITKSGNVIINN